jgi:DNA-binding MarR family transcriptional regulator
MARKRTPAATAQAVALVREFNRFYTKQIGVLQEGLLASSYSLTEARLMYELLQHPSSTASEIAEILGINHGYLSRMLHRFESLGLVKKTRSSNDGRHLLLTLTAKGKLEYGPLNRRANSEVGRLLKGLSTKEIHTLLESMQTIRRLLSPSGR